MTTVYLAPGPFGIGGQFFTTAGLPLNAGLIYTYSAGTTTPLATYTTSAGSVQNANPIVLDADGRTPNEIWLTSVAYRFDLKDSLGNLIKTYDNIPGGLIPASDLAASTGAGLVGFSHANTYSQGTEGLALQAFVNVKNAPYNAACDGITDDTTAIQSALNSGALNILFPAMCLISSPVTASTAKQTIYSNGNGGMKLKAASNSAMLIIAANNISIRNLELDGNRANQTTNYVTHLNNGVGSGIVVNANISYVSVQKNYIHDMSVHGVIGLGTHNYCNYSENLIESIGVAGIYPTIDSALPFSYGAIQRNVIHNIGLAPNAAADTSHGGDGIGPVGIQYTSIIGNVIRNGWTSCIALEGGCHDVSITGNTCDAGLTFSAVVSGAPTNTGTVSTGPTIGIQLNDCWNVSVAGNSIENAWQGITVSGADNTRGIAIGTNNIKRCIDRGIFLYESSGTSQRWSDITVTGNVISNTYGIPISSGLLSGVIIAENEISGVNIGNCTARGYGYGVQLFNAQAHSSVINNTINQSTIGSDGATGHMNVGVGEMYFSGGTPQRNFISMNRINGATYYDVIALPALALVNSYPSASIIELLTLRSNSTPSTGFWTNSQVNYRPNSAAGSPAADFCVTAGEFGSQTCTVNMASTSANITNFSTMAGFFDGMNVSIAGAGPAAAALTGYLYNCDPIALTASLILNGAAQTASTTVTAAAMTLVNPTFKTQGNLA